MTPDHMTPERPTGVAYEQALAARRGAQPYDPLRLCVYATVALLSWLLGAWAVLGFAALGLAGYWRARRAGLDDAALRARLGQALPLNLGALLLSLLGLMCVVVGVVLA